MAKRGANGRFTSADEPAPAALDPNDMPPLFDLEIEPQEPTIEPAELPLPPAPPDAPAEADAGGADVTLATALARGIDEAVGLMFGAGYRAQPEQIAAVGEAAAPVLTRALTFVHAGELAEANVPAPVRELATLAARVYVAWGDAFVLIVRQRIAELRAQREEADGSQSGSTDRGNGGVRGAGRSNGSGDADPAALSAADVARPDTSVGPDPGAQARFDELLALDAVARRRRPD